VSALSTWAVQGWWSYRATSSGAGRGSSREHTSSTRKHCSTTVTSPDLESLGARIAVLGKKSGKDRQRREQNCQEPIGKQNMVDSLGAASAGKTRLEAELERERIEGGDGAGLRAVARAKTGGAAKSRRLGVRAQGQALHRVGESQGRRGEHSG
jgi:hypothetical protein